MTRGGTERLRLHGYDVLDGVSCTEGAEYSVRGVARASSLPARPERSPGEDTAAPALEAAVSLTPLPDAGVVARTALSAGGPELGRRPSALDDPAAAAADVSVSLPASEPSVAFRTSVVELGRRRAKGRGVIPLGWGVIPLRFRATDLPASLGASASPAASVLWPRPLRPLFFGTHLCPGVYISSSYFLIASMSSSTGSSGRRLKRTAS